MPAAMAPGFNMDKVIWLVAVSAGMPESVTLTYNV